MEAIAALAILDCLIIGGGPAGIQAAIYLASEGHSVRIVEKANVLGGQIRRSPLIENVAGHVAISGLSLINRAEQQLRNFGVQVSLNTEAVNVISDTINGKVLTRLSDGTEIVSRSVLLSTGVEFRPFPFKGNDNHNVVWGPYYYRSHNVENALVVGGGNSAGQFALSIQRKAKNVTIATRSPLQNSMSHYLIERLMRSGITIYSDCVPEKYTGKNMFLSNGIKVRADKVYAFAGTAHVPIPVYVASDKGISLVEPLPDGSYPHNSLSMCGGVYVAGDARGHAMRRVAAALGDGANVASLIGRYLSA